MSHFFLEQIQTFTLLDFVVYFDTHLNVSKKYVGQRIDASLVIQEERRHFTNVHISFFLLTFGLIFSGYHGSQQETRGPSRSSFSIPIGIDEIFDYSAMRCSTS